MPTLGYLEEATHFSAVGTFAPMTYEEWDDVFIQIDATCIKENNTTGGSSKNSGKEETDLPLKSVTKTTQEKNSLRISQTKNQLTRKSN